MTSHDKVGIGSSVSILHQDMDAEMGAMQFTMRKLWSGIRTMWRNSPTTSSSPEVQALKDLMVSAKKEGEECPALHNHAGDGAHMNTSRYIMIWLYH